MKRLKSWNKTITFLGVLLISLSSLAAWGRSSCKVLVLKELDGRGFGTQGLFDNFVVESEAMWDVIHTILQIPDGVAVLIVGETGVGKEHVARVIHELSSRRGRPYVVLDSGALPQDLVLSTLFGHVKGSFTGAHKNQTGLLSEANQGTFFLDEVFSLSPEVQHHFLRVLQERVFRPVGSNEELRSDFRLIAATNQSPEVLVQKGFREDLYYRLAEFVLVVPPLRERPEDVAALAPYFLRQFGGDLALSEPALNRLMNHPWTGNVRELRHVVIQSVVNARRRLAKDGTAKQKTIEIDDLALGDAQPLDLEARIAHLLSIAPQLPTFKVLPKEVKRLLIEEALRRAQTQEAAAQMIGITRATLNRLRHELNPSSGNGASPHAPDALPVLGEPTY